MKYHSHPRLALFALLALGLSYTAMTGTAWAIPIMTVQFDYTGNSQNAEAQAIFDIDLGNLKTVQHSGRRDFGVNRAVLSASFDNYGPVTGAIVDLSTTDFFGFPILGGCHASFTPAGNFLGVDCGRTQLPISGGVNIQVFSGIIPNGAHPDGTLRSQYVHITDLFLKRFQVLSRPAEVPAPQTLYLLVLGICLLAVGALPGRAQRPASHRRI